MDKVLLLDVFNEIELSINKQKNLDDNFFSILGIEKWEIKHSKFLAFLLDKTRNGDIGTQFIGELLKFLKIKNHLSLIKKDYIITTEEEHTDILIIFPNELIIVIENKIDAEESEGQLSSYFDTIKDRTKSYCITEPICMFLTPDKRETRKQEDKNWILCDYKQIYKIIKKITVSNDKIQYFLNDYLNILEEKVIMKDEYDDFKLLKEMYKSGKSEKNTEEKNTIFKTCADLIMKYMPNYFDRANVCKNTIEKYQEFILKGGNQAYIFFYSKKIQSALKRKGINENLIKFQLHNNIGHKEALYIYADYENEQEKALALQIKKFLNYKNKGDNASNSKNKTFSFNYSYELIKEPNNNSKTEYTKKVELEKNLTKWFEEESAKVVDEIVKIIEGINNI